LLQFRKTLPFCDRTASEKWHPTPFRWNLRLEPAIGSLVFVDGIRDDGSIDDPAEGYEKARWL
jgi:hypothetical protein